ncbi:MAG: hypothetical protein FJY21_07655 [Bacteroidetes bacterium]|nr:hypothetical protein [Bacteroidota bacterium]
MLKKILLNIFLNVAIIILVMCIAWAVKNAFYLYVFAAIPPLAMLIYLKFRLVKSFRSLTNKTQK